MLRIKEIVADGVKKFALLRLEDNGGYTELGVYARNAYAVKKAKSVMSETKEVIECKFNGVLDVWKLQDDELVSNNSTIQTTLPEQADLNEMFKAVGEVLYLVHKANSIMDFINGAKRIDVNELDEDIEGLEFHQLMNKDKEYMFKEIDEIFGKYQHFLKID